MLSGVLRGESPAVDARPALSTPDGIVKLLTLLPSPCHNDRGDAPSQTKLTLEKAADMTPPADSERYKNHRFPGEIISHGVWLYYRFPLSYRDVQEILCERGIDVTHEAIRQWCLKFGQDYANQLKHRRAQPGDKWHLDEVFLTINGQRHYLWR